MSSDRSNRVKCPVCSEEATMSDLKDVTFRKTTGYESCIELSSSPTPTVESICTFTPLLFLRNGLFPFPNLVGLDGPSSCSRDINEIFSFFQVYRVFQLLDTSKSSACASSCVVPHETMHRALFSRIMCISRDEVCLRHEAQLDVLRDLERITNIQIVDIGSCEAELSDRYMDLLQLSSVIGAAIDSLEYKISAFQKKTPSLSLVNVSERVLAATSPLGNPNRSHVSICGSATAGGVSSPAILRQQTRTEESGMMPPQGSHMSHEHVFLQSSSSSTIDSESWLETVESVSRSIAAVGFNNEAAKLSSTSLESILQDVYHVYQINSGESIFLHPICARCITMWLIEKLASHRFQHPYTFASEPIPPLEIIACNSQPPQEGYELDERWLRTAEGLELMASTVVKGRVLEVECVRITQQIRQRYPCLKHMPLHANVVFIEIDLHDLVSPSILQRFSDELSKRSSLRLKRAEVEKRQSRRLNAERYVLLTVRCTYCTVLLTWTANVLLLVTVFRCRDRI
jgi:hypothetical protein